MKHFFVFFIFCSVFFSCTNKADHENPRTLLLKFTDEQQMKSEFQKLPKDMQINVWKDKLQNLLNQDLPKEHLALINQLMELLNSQVFDFGNQEMREITVKLLKITPREDMALMFEKLQNYEYKGQFIGKDICSACIKDIETPSVHLKTDGEVRQVRCNCFWTCLVSGGGDCTPTASGCGFLWKQGCIGRY